MSDSAIATTSLDLLEGVELAYALTARVADDVGARALAIKGRVNEAHGLRTPRASADADVLIEPGKHDRVVAALVGLGWRSARTSPIPAPFGSHAITLNHPQWPCELDLHDRFPGFFADPADAFDALWSERTFMEAANVAVPATGIYGTTLVMGLHALRTPNDSRNGRELAELVERLSSRRLDPERLRRLAEATGCLDTGSSLLTALGADVSAVDPPESSAGSEDPRLIQWELRQAVGQMPSLGWLMALRRTPARQLPSLVVTMLLSTEAALRRYHPQAPAGRRGLWMARWWRLKRAVRKLPRAHNIARQLSKTNR